jgi:hypothetical protein
VLLTPMRDRLDSDAAVPARQWHAAVTAERSERNNPVFAPRTAGPVNDGVIPRGGSSLLVRNHTVPSRSTVSTPLTFFRAAMIRLRCSRFLTYTRKIP